MIDVDVTRENELKESLRKTWTVKEFLSIPRGCADLVQIEKEDWENGCQNCMCTWTGTLTMFQYTV